MPLLGYDSYREEGAIWHKIQIVEAMIADNIFGVMLASKDEKRAGLKPLRRLLENTSHSPSIYYPHDSVAEDQEIAAWLSQQAAGLPIGLYTQIVEQDKQGDYYPVGEPDLRVESREAEYLTWISFNVDALTHSEHLRLAQDTLNTVRQIGSMVGQKYLKAHFVELASV